ncbi:MAG TPA: QsdR family transcriptional regulator [Acidimicrobiales bacterium]
MSVDDPPAPEAPARADLLALARRRFLKGERLDMRAMGAQLGVSRTTVYRWAGNHDQLLGEVISGLAYETFVVAERGVRQSGRARVLAVYRNFLRLLATSDPVRAALLRDPRQFLRVTTRSGPVTRMVATLFGELVRREVERGTLRVSTDVAALAPAMVRIAEAAIYADMLAGAEPDIEPSVEIVAMLLAPDGDGN